MAKTRRCADLEDWRTGGECPISRQDFGGRVATALASINKQRAPSFLTAALSKQTTHEPQTLFEPINLLRWLLVKLLVPSCYLYDRPHALAGREQGRVFERITVAPLSHPNLVGL